jgi:hypothetical protein
MVMIDVHPIQADTAPITAYRYHSFASRLGDDDMFSSDLTADEAKARLGRCSPLAWWCEHR